MRTIGTTVVKGITALKPALVLFTLSCGAWLAIAQPGLPAAGEKLELTVVDVETGQPLPCRIHLRDQRGRPRRVGRLPALGDHLATGGPITLPLPVGSTQFEIERGPEYVLRTGHFVLQKFSDDTKTVDLKRIVDMSREGWWSGDLHLERTVEELPQLMEAEDLHIAANVTWTNKQSLWNRRAVPESTVVKFDNDRYCDILAGRDERLAGSLLLFRLEQPWAVKSGAASSAVPAADAIAGGAAAMPRADAALPTPADIAASVRRQGGWVDVENPFSPDLPVLLARGEIDSFQLAHGDLQRSKTVPTDVVRFLRGKEERPGALAAGEWAQRIYYHLLESGFRVPPSAGSGSGANDNPVGYNRMYVHVAGDFNWESWWEGFRAGRVMVTNGPLLRPHVEGQLPGHVFTAAEGEELQLQAALSMATRENVQYLEVVQNGKVVHVVRLNDWAQQNGRLPAIQFRESGWFLIRAVAENNETYRFGSTAPYYVEVGGKPRISRKSAEFFLAWVEARLQSLEQGSLPAESAGPIRDELEAARRFWASRSRDATAE